MPNKSSYKFLYKFNPIYEETKYKHYVYSSIYCRLPHLCGCKSSRHTLHLFKPLAGTITETVRNAVVLSRVVGDGEPEWLDCQVPPCDLSVCVLHPLNPLKSFVVRFQRELPPKKVILERIQGQLDGQCLLLHR